MTANALALIGITIIFSSFVSGVFGMAGGMVLLGVLLVYFDVATGMVLFSIIQLAANGWRALVWRSSDRIGFDRASRRTGTRGGSGPVPAADLARTVEPCYHPPGI